MWCWLKFGWVKKKFFYGTGERMSLKDEREFFKPGEREFLAAAHILTTSLMSETLRSVVKQIQLLPLHTKQTPTPHTHTTVAQQVRFRYCICLFYENIAVFFSSVTKKMGGKKTKHKTCSICKITPVDTHAHRNSVRDTDGPINLRLQGWMGWIELLYLSLPLGLT